MGGNFSIRGTVFAGGGHIVALAETRKCENFSHATGDSFAALAEMR